MAEEYPILGLPALRENPFKARPLEPGQAELLVARDELSARWSRFLKNRTPRLILLIGERGSGRSSLMRCMSRETSKSVHLDMFPTENHSHSILNELFVSMIGFDVPSSTQEIASRLVSFTENLDGSIPLISLDFPNVDGSHLSQVISNLISPLERLNAVVIISLSTEQRAQWPTSLVTRFDHTEVIQPLQAGEVKELCEARIATTSKLGWSMNEDALDYVMDKTGGSPYKVMRLLREIVDDERANPREIQYDDLEVDTVQEEIENKTNHMKEFDAIDKTLDPQNSFDLDLDRLRNPPAEYQSPPPVSSMGGFGALVARNRLNKTDAPAFDKTKAEYKVPEKLAGEENQLWISDDPSATLIQPIQDNHQFEDDYFSEDEEMHEDNIIDSRTNKDVEGLFSQLLDAIGVPDGLGLADLLAALRRPVIGQRSSSPLDVQTLRNLSKSEAVLVEVSSEREISPSDNRLQDRLNVGRPRMSQMCNRLYRSGILSVQQKGRSRMFKLTNDARAQLVAWGMMEVSV